MNRFEVWVLTVWVAVVLVVLVREVVREAKADTARARRAAEMVGAVKFNRKPAAESSEELAEVLPFLPRAERVARRTAAEKGRLA